MCQVHQKFLIIIFVFGMLSQNIFGQQINISRIEMMPNFPQPYEMRNWKNVALGYDALAFNLNLTGNYLPLIWTDNNSTNYPGQLRFGLATVVGTTDPTSAEAINCLPAVIGASLVGVDKSNQNGYNWVKMCGEWFNKRNGLGVYKNHPDDMTYDDFWYETMPNVFFYQLYYLYPNTSIFQAQFTSVADKWLEAVKKMGGSATPWTIPNVNHRGFDLQNMVPYNASVYEPEAAGALAWILYNAYVKTGVEKYRVGAEWCMEYLNSLSSNPAYELQLSYGVYTAARMNAELGTNYDVTKMLNWCFNVGPLRNWGAMTNSTWGGYDVDGLIGEVNGSNNYPFSMNTFEQVGALVPLVRYDSRLARAIGKWVLNVANASRLFYPNYLPAQNQDQPSKTWADQYDKNFYIAHEAMHQYNPSNFSVSPFASGDAINGGWGSTTLTLYSSSHVGILGAIIDTTNVIGILQLNLLKTDYFHQNAYPTYLYYNPYDSSKTVQIDVGAGSHDIYDVITKQFISTSVSNVTSFEIPANSAVVLVITPAGGTQSYNEDKFLINGVVVDFHSGHFTGNYPPRIKDLASVKDTVLVGDTTMMYCTAVDVDGDSLSYDWQNTGGSIFGSGSNIKWIAPDSSGRFAIQSTVTDEIGNSTKTSDTITVVKIINHPPVIEGFKATPRKIGLGKNSVITCFATDADKDSLNFTWSSKTGVINGTDSTINWTAPGISGNFYIKCKVSDSKGGIVSDSIEVEVRDLTIQQTGDLVAYYPFNGNALDASGFNNNGSVNGAALTSDRFGNPNSAYFFNGTNNDIQVPSSASLNFQNAITINFWMKVKAFLNKEQYIISHGSYTNRWKASIIPNNNKLRWTIKTDTTINNGIIDLDSETPIIADSLYNVTLTYSGSDMEIYLNGYLDSFTKWGGHIATTNVTLTIGQMLPTDQGYNFYGTLDDIRIYDYELPLDKIEELYNATTGVSDINNLVPISASLMQNYPNPFNPSTNITFDLNKSSIVNLTIYNILGQKIQTLINGFKSPGRYSVLWKADSFPSGIYFYRLKTNDKFFTKKMILLK